MELTDVMRTTFAARDFTDAPVSDEVLYRILDELDPGRSYFYASDIREFESKYRYKLDDAFKKDDLAPGFEIYNRYQKRAVERLNDVIKQVEKGVDNLKFDIDETLQIDRKDSPWPDSEAAMNELWRKRLKNNNTDGLVIDLMTWSANISAPWKCRRN